MPSIIDNAKQAGFSDDEIGQWASGLRTQAKAAGFNDDEVSAYLGGGIPAPTKVPQPFIDRLLQGTHLSSLWSHLQSGADKADAHSYVAGPGTFLQGAAQGFDTSAPHIFSESFENDLRSAGLIADPATGRAGPVRFINEALMRPIGNLFDMIGRAAGAGVSGAAETIGETVNRLGGPSEKAKAEVQNFGNYGMAEAMGRGGHIAGIGHDVTGRPIDLPLGGVPKTEDFSAAAKGILPDADTPFMQKLRSLYEDKGLLPAEVAHEAQHDVTVTQALASRGSDLPERYQGSTQLETPAKAAERTEPLPASAAPPPPRPAVDTPQPTPALPSTIPNNIRSFAPSDLTVDADRFQFKSGGDEAGVTDRLQGVSTWDPIKAGLGLVWEDENGENFIVDGHQRHALAKRIEQADPEQAPRLNAVVVRQADDVSDVEARIMAASKNMAEGTGTAIDAAKILRDQPDLIKELPPRSELVRQARSLAELGDEPFRMVVNDVVPPNFASIVGRLAPKDDDLQGALLQLLAKTEPANAVQAEAIVRQGIAAGTRSEKQATLFGDEQVVLSLYADRAKVLDRALRELKQDRLVFSAIVRDQDIIQAVGNRLETSANANRAAADAQAVQILQVLANRRGPLSDALSAAARRAADGDSPGAIRSFVAAIRSQAEAGDLVRAADGLERGRIDAGAENAANLVDPARTEPRRGAEAAATKSATDAIKQAQAHAPVTEQTAQGEQIVMPSMERSAAQAAAAREAEGHGMLASERPQEAPGGLFEAPKEDEPGLIFGPETGAISWGPPPPKTPLDLARDSILDKISIGERSPKRSLTFSQAYTNFVDQFYPIDEATPVGTPTATNPYRLSRLLSGLGAKIDHILKHGTLDWNTLQPNGASLEQVLAPVKNDLQNFRAFAVAAHALEMEAEGITSGMDTGAARTVAREGVTKYGPVLEELVNYQNRVAAYLRDSGVISHDTYDAMTQRWQLYIPANRVLGDGDGAFGRGGGLQPSDPIHRILGSARDWVDPIENVIRNTAIYTTMADKNAVMQSLRDTLAAGGQIGPGSVSPIALIPTAADPALDAALDAWLTAHGVPAPPAGVMNFFRAAGAQPDAKGTISLYDNGVHHSYKVDPEIAEAAKGLNRETANLILRTMAPFTAMLRAGAVLAPEFGLRHPFRDFFYASIFNEGGFSPLDMARGFAGYIAKSDEYWHWAASGGGNASMVSLDRRYLQENLEHITQQTGLLTRTINTVFDSNASWLNRVSAIPGLPFKAAQRYVLRPLQVFTELAENASHLGKFIREERATTAATGAPLTRDELLEAGWKSRDTAVDAARIGAKMHALNMISAFANIIVQDTDRWVRGFRDDPVSASLKVMAYITIPQTLLWLYQHDDPRYEELPAWQRVLTIPILTDKWEDVGPAGQYGPPAPGTPYRVQDGRMQVNNGAIFRWPQPFSLGVIFGAGTIAALEAFSQHSAKPIGDWLEGLKSVAVPGILPNVGDPILEQFANRSTFTNRTLIPDRFEHGMPEYQYTPYTTEAAKALGRLFGAFPGMRERSITPGAMGGGVARALTSPILIENYIRGWTGGLGVYALEIADAALRKEGILPDPPKPASTLADIPFVKAFTIRYPSASAESIQNFQDRYEANRTYYNTWLDKSKQGDAAAATRILQIGGPRMFVQLDQIKQTIGEQSKLIEDVSRDPKSSSSDKRQLIDTIYYRTIELARAGNAALDKIDSALPRTVH